MQSNKLRLEGPLWLAVQQQLYRGWGPFIAAIAALVCTLAMLVWQRSGTRQARRALAVAAAAYAGMISVFFIFNAPVNAALSAWTPASLPPDWPIHRLQWEIGNALAALLSVAALSALLQAKRKAAPSLQAKYFVGDKRCVLIDFTGVAKYAKPACPATFARDAGAVLSGWKP